MVPLHTGPQNPNVQPSMYTLASHKIYIVYPPHLEVNSLFCSQMLFLATFFPTWEGGIYDFIGVSGAREGRECRSGGPGTCAN